jgi:iron complex outermembrane receptor protein
MPSAVLPPRIFPAPALFFRFFGTPHSVKIVVDRATRSAKTLRRQAIRGSFMVACGWSTECARAEDLAPSSTPRQHVATPEVSHHHAPPRAPIVVTASPPLRSGEVILDPRAARQPVPASDGADYLSSVPGFAAIGNGGTNGDPVFRGIGGGRLRVLSNGATLQGACGARMDAPTAYLSPETFEAVHIVKGPGTVRWGPVALAGTVRFDRATARFDTPDLRFHGAVLGGMYGRHDALVDLTVGGPRGDARVIANRTHADDYRDGAGRSIPARWDKWQIDTQFNWYLTERTHLTLEAGTGDGQVRYASRGMDGASFRRDSLAFSVKTERPDARLRSASAQWYVNRVDHVMDNFSLRTARVDNTTPGAGSRAAPVGMQNYRLTASNPGRTLMGGRGELQWSLASRWQVFTGIDGLTERQSGRFTEIVTPATDSDRAAAARPDVGALPRRINTVQARVGLFAQSEWRVGPRDGVTIGARIDRAYASDRRKMTQDRGLPGQRQMWTSGSFVRWEHDAAHYPLTFFVGVGQTRRTPDYWELFSAPNGPAHTVNAFNGLRPEKATQIDIGFHYDDSEDSGPQVKSNGTLAGTFGNRQHHDARAVSTSGRQLWFAAYAASVRDFILFDYAPGTVSRVKNVNAQLYGLEAGFSLPLHPRWRIDASTALAMGENRSEKRPLAQMPPLDTRVGLHYREGPWSAGFLWRIVATQRRWAAHQGTVAGRDFRATGGYGVMSINASYAISRIAALHIGIDNLFNKTYAEHLNRQGAPGLGFVGNVAFNDPGRMAWAKLIVDL